jgi:serine/threonine-protein kinase
VLDFGIAKIVGGSALTTRNLGTPVYMSPEQVRGDGDVDAAADLYALGQIAFTLLVGEPYWREESAAGGRVLFDRIERGGVEPASARAARRGVRLPAAFDAWFAKATAPDPDDRFEAAGDLVMALGEALMGAADAASQTVGHHVDLRARRWSTRAVMALALVAIGLSAGTWGVLRAVVRARGDDASAVVTAPSAVAMTTPADRQTGPETPSTSAPQMPERVTTGHASATAAARARSGSGQPPAPPTSSSLGPIPARSAAASATAAPPQQPPASAASASPFGPGAF